MKVFKPMSLALLTRPFEFQRRFRLGVAVLSFVPIGTRPALLSDMSLWKFLPEELPPDQAIDAVIPKIGSEYLVVGRACAPAGTVVPALRVAARVGKYGKALHVFGDRSWNGDRPSDPVPFETMPLDWAHAYGGASHAENPLGRGAEAVDTPEGRRLPIPNIIDAGEGAGRYRRTAGFGPLDQAWPQRARLAGTYDGTWLEQDFPGFARDINWRFFNIAPVDQQIVAPFAGDEDYSLENMHPDAPVLAGKLPGLIPRAFLERRDGDAFEEVALKLTTLWFFPHRRRLVMVHHGYADLAEEDGADIERMIIGADWIGRPRAPDAFRAVMQARMDKKKGPLLAMRDRDLVPAEVLVPDPALEAAKALDPNEGLQLKHARKRSEREIQARRDYVAGFGLDPDIHGPSLPPPEQPLPTLETLPEMVDGMLAEAEREKAAQEQARAEADKEIEKLLAGSGMTMEQIKAEREAAPAGPPEFTAAGKRRELEELSRGMRVLGQDSSHVDEILDDPEANKMWQQAEDQLREAYRLTAHMQGPARPKDWERCRQVREALAGPPRSWARADLTGLDLSGLDLSGLALGGIDLEGAWLDGADLRQTDLSHANLRNAVLAHAKLDGVRLDQADLTGANLGNTCLRGASLRGATLVEAILAKADLQDVVLQGARLDKANLAEARLAGVDLSGAQAEGLILMKVTVTGLRAAGAKLGQLKALECDLSGANLAGAQIDSAMFYKCRLTGIDASRARIRKSMFTADCDLGQAVFAHADLTGSNLRGVALPGADLSFAILNDADFSKSDLSGARLFRVRAHRTQFVAARLPGAQLNRADLLGASVARTDLRGADLTEANLHGADAARVRLDQDSRTAGMLQTKMRYRPRLLP